MIFLETVMYPERFLADTTQLKDDNTTASDPVLVLQ